MKTPKRKKLSSKRVANEHTMMPEDALSHSVLEIEEFKAEESYTQSNLNDPQFNGEVGSLSGNEIFKGSVDGLSPKEREHINAGENQNEKEEMLNNVNRTVETNSAGKADRHD